MNPPCQAPPTLQYTLQTNIGIRHSNTDISDFFYRY